MAQKSKPRTPQKSSYRGFEGVDLKKTHSGDESIALIDNFRITDDGSLKKRQGFKKIYENKEKTSPLSASYSLLENGVEVCYFTQGSYVKKYRSDTQEVINVGSVKSEATNIFFFEFMNSLYICDGYQILTIKNNSLFYSKFYVPLYGKDWGIFGGEVYEKPNLLWPKIAISYKLSEDFASYLSLGNLNIKSIDAVYRNGTALPSDKYYYHEEYNAITVLEFDKDDFFFAILTIVPDENYLTEQEALFNSTHTSLFPELNENNLFFWGSKSSNSVFFSTSINPDSAKLTDNFTSHSRFYIPIGSYFSVASAEDRIKAFTRHYDRVLIMTDSSTWITNLRDLETNSMLIKNINSSIGCEVANGCVRIENTIFSIGKDAIYAWTADTDELNECNAYSISEPIKDLLGKDFYSSCLIHLNYAKREIWFFSPTQSQTWIYSYTNKKWYSFSGFTPTAFLDGGDEVRFLEDKILYAFDKDLNSDIRNEGEAEITATLKSGMLEFNSERKKKLSSATVRGSLEGGSLELNVMLDEKRRITYPISPSAHHSVISFRIKSGSFRYMTFELTAKGKGEQIIHGIELNAD